MNHATFRNFLHNNGFRDAMYHECVAELVGLGVVEPECAVSSRRKDIDR
ncbi:hypothetical protein ABIA30_000943 [Mycobacterium sp. MAA66]